MTENQIKVGARVEAGVGQDYDTGRVIEIDGAMAIVAWDSGVRTPCPLADLAVIADDRR